MSAELHLLVLLEDSHQTKYLAVDTTVYLQLDMGPVRSGSSLQTKPRVNINPAPAQVMEGPSSNQQTQFGNIKLGMLQQ